MHARMRAGLVQWRRLQTTLLRHVRQYAHVRGGWRKWGLSACVLALLLGVADVCLPPPLDKARDISPVVLDVNGAPLRAFPLKDGRWRLKADLDATDPAFIEALLAYEDKRFYAHPGVDAAAMMRAFMGLVKAGRVVSGGSTITMQTARLLEPQERTVGAKLHQMVRAMQLERRLSKQEILELYLTLAPYGGNLEGVRSASWAYFGREPRELTPDQIALLIALPQSPEARRPDLRPENAVIARGRVLDRLVEKGVIAAPLAMDAQLAPAPVRRAFPAYAWHAAEKARDMVTDMAPTGRADIVTTLDIRLQSELEILALKTVQDMDPQVQMAAMIVDIDSRSVLAAVGSAQRQRPGGWLDLTNRPRSPGSTLKPFIYGMAFDDGIAASATRIADLPRQFNSYRPENFDRTFRGDVTISEALQHSLNVPAVQTLEAVGPRRFAASLGFAGAAPVLPSGADDAVGLALALGGAGMTVRDIATLYAALGGGGEAAALHWLAPEEKQSATVAPEIRRLLSEESAGEILDILRRAPSPAGRAPSALTRNAPRIAFKTGTSYGFRDAWAAGVSGGRAIVVWIGRADGAPRPGATGRITALPVLFDAFDMVERLSPGRSGGGAFPGDGSEGGGHEGSVPLTLTRFEADGLPPEILFPPDNAEIWADRPGRAFVLSARGDGILSWYVDGRRTPRNASGDSVWRPDAAGFYTLIVMDENGRSRQTQVRVSLQAD